MKKNCLKLVFTYNNIDYELHSDSSFYKNGVLIQTRKSCNYLFYKHLPFRFFRSLGYPEKYGYYVHKLVYFAFNLLPDDNYKDEEKMKQFATLTIDHIDNDSCNNHMDNLQLISLKDNVRKRNFTKVANKIEILLIVKNCKYAYIFSCLNQAMNYCGEYIKHLHYENRKQNENNKYKFYTFDDAKGSKLPKLLDEDNYTFFKLPDINTKRLTKEWRRNELNNIDYLVNKLENKAKNHQI